MREWYRYDNEVYTVRSTVCFILKKKFIFTVKMYILRLNIYILTVKMYIFTVKIYIFSLKIYILTVKINFFFRMKQTVDRTVYTSLSYLYHSLIGV